MDFVEFGRQHIEQAAGGNAALDGRRRLRPAAGALALQARGRVACTAPPGLNLYAISTTLTRNAQHQAAIPPQSRWTRERPPCHTGRLQVPELDMHTISDQLVPVQQENYYRHTVAVRRAQRPAPPGVRPAPAATATSRRPSWWPACTRSSSGSTAGRWDHVADPAALNASANARGPGPRRAGVHPVRAGAAVRRQRAVRPVHRQGHSRSAAGRRSPESAAPGRQYPGCRRLPSERARRLGVGRLGLAGSVAVALAGPRLAGGPVRWWFDPSLGGRRRVLRRDRRAVRRVARPGTARAHDAASLRIVARGCGACRCC